MKKIVFLLFVLLQVVAGKAMSEVSFEFSDGINGALKTKMEQQLSRLLTAINTAADANRDEINFSGIQFERSETANQTISMLWNSVHFSTQDDDIYEPCLQLKRGGRVTGYQVRNIYMDMKPIDDSYDEDRSQEFIIEFDTQGRISDVNIAMGKLQYQELLKEGELLNDFDQRQQIIYFCEQLKGAYNKMDIQFMEDVFSDDALIVTGRVRQRVKGSAISVQRNDEVKLPNQSNTEYTVQTKQQYLSKLSDTFKRQRNMKGGYINVKFDEYKVVRHPAKPNYYGVTLKQSWHSKGYSDEGILFLVWDFSNEEHPTIHVRTWQAMNTDERDIFTLNNFKLK